LGGGRRPPRESVEHEAKKGPILSVCLLENDPSPRRQHMLQVNLGPVRAPNKGAVSMLIRYILLAS